MQRIWPGWMARLGGWEGYEVCHVERREGAAPEIWIYLLRRLHELAHRQVCDPPILGAPWLPADCCRATATTSAARQTWSGSTNALLPRTVIAISSEASQPQD